MIANEIIEIFSNLTATGIRELGIIAFLGWVVYNVFVKKQVDSIKSSVENFSTRQSALEQANKIMLYKQMQDMYIQAANKSSKTFEEDDIFKQMWHCYKDLGDGHGDELLNSWTDIDYNTTKKVECKYDK